MFVHKGLILMTVFVNHVVQIVLLVLTQQFVQVVMKIKYLLIHGNVNTQNAGLVII